MIYLLCALSFIAVVIGIVVLGVMLHLEHDKRQNYMSKINKTLDF